MFRPELVTSENELEHVERLRLKQRNQELKEKAATKSRINYELHLVDTGWFIGILWAGGAGLIDKNEGAWQLGSGIGAMVLALGLHIVVKWRIRHGKYRQ